jgi:hypothetical protein
MTTPPARKSKQPPAPRVYKVRCVEISWKFIHADMTHIDSRKGVTRSFAAKFLGRHDVERDKLPEL